MKRRDNALLVAILAAGLGVVVAVGIGAWAAGHYTRKTETVRVAGAAMKATVHGREISWPATRSGGITAFVRYGRGWVIYTARLTVR